MEGHLELARLQIFTHSSSFPSVRWSGDLILRLRETVSSRTRATSYLKKLYSEAMCLLLVA